MKKIIASFFVIFIGIFILFFIPNSYLMAQGLENIDKNSGILIKYKNSEKLHNLKVDSGGNILELLKKYNNDPSVEYAENDDLYKATIIPSDFYYKNQWYLKKIKAPDAWNEVNQSSVSVIAIIDSGVQIDHPDLVDNIWVNKNEIPDNGIDDDHNGYIDDVNGWDFVGNVADPSPKFTKDYTMEGISHGTVVAGIAAASGNNNIGISGVAWSVKIMPLRVLDSNGQGKTSSVVAAVDYAIKNGADVINFSFIGANYNRSMERAVKRAYDAGVVVVAAAGNDETDGAGQYLDDKPMYPVCYDGEDGENMVIGVAATDVLDQKTAFSGYGHNCIDISAPGVSVFSTSAYYPDMSYMGKAFDTYYDGYWSGTSMAVPMVSASISLIEEMNPSLSMAGVVGNLLNGADDISRLNPDYYMGLGSGRLNVYRSVLLAKFELEQKKPRLVVDLSGDNNGEIKIVNKDNVIDSTFRIKDFNQKNGARIAAGEINKDGVSEVVVGGDSDIRILNTAGKLLKQFLAYDKNFIGGVNVAIGDINGDGVGEIVSGPVVGSGPQIRVFNESGKILKQFLAYDKNFRGGVNVAVGDVDGDGVSEIVTGPGVGGGPSVRIFDENGKLLGQFLAYDKNFRGGINVAVGDVDGTNRRNKREIITAPVSKGSPQVRIFDEHGKFVDDFWAYDKKFRGGVNIAAGDVDRDGLDEIITGAASSGNPHVLVFEKSGLAISSFYAFKVNAANGVHVAYYE